MKKLIIALSVLAVTFAACDNNNTEAADGTTENTERKYGKKIKTESDSLSYAVGVDLGSYLNNLKAQAGNDVNVDMVFAAVKDVMNDKYTLDQSEAMNFLQNYFSVRLPERKKEQGAAFLEKVKAENPNIQETESGLLYEIIEQGSEKVATNPKDKVRVTYRGMLKDGEEFDSSFSRNDTTQFAINGVIKGWSEGLQLIGEGGKIKLWIPADLAYGQYGAGGKVGPNEPLVFDVDLIEVIPFEEPVQ